MEERHENMEIGRYARVSMGMEGAKWFVDSNFGNPHHPRKVRKAISELQSRCELQDSLQSNQNDLNDIHVIKTKH